MYTCFLDRANLLFWVCFCLFCFDFLALTSKSLVYEEVTNSTLYNKALLFIILCRIRKKASFSIKWNQREDLSLSRCFRFLRFSLTGLGARSSVIALHGISDGSSSSFSLSYPPDSLSNSSRALLLMPRGSLASNPSKIELFPNLNPSWTKSIAMTFLFMLQTKC